MYSKVSSRKKVNKSASNDSESVSRPVATINGSTKSRKATPSMNAQTSTKSRPNHSTNNSKYQKGKIEKEVSNEVISDASNSTSNTRPIRGYKRKHPSSCASHLNIHQFSKESTSVFPPSNRSPLSLSNESISSVESFHFLPGKSRLEYALMECRVDTKSKKSRVFRSFKNANQEKNGEYSKERRVVLPLDFSLHLFRWSFSKLRRTGSLLLKRKMKQKLKLPKIKKSIRPKSLPSISLSPDTIQRLLNQEFQAEMQKTSRFLWEYERNNNGDMNVFTNEKDVLRMENETIEFTQTSGKNKGARARRRKVLDFSDRPYSSRLPYNWY